jgi:hypothetical protein
VLGLGKQLTKGGKIVFRNFLTLHKTRNEGRKTTVEDSFKKTATLFQLAMALIDGRSVTELAPRNLDGERAFLRESANERLNRAGLPVQPTFQFTHNIA